MKKLVVFFPGMGYGMDSPLLYYADFLYETNGYERKVMDYQSIVLNLKLSVEDKKKMIRESVINQAKDIEFDTYEEIVFISKSIGTVEAGWLAKQLSVKVTQIFMTPMSDTISYFGADDVVVIGTTDMAYENVKAACDEKGIRALYIENANHSLEVNGEPLKSIEVLKNVMKFIER